MRLVLASTSPARLTTLRAAGLHPEPIPPEVDEEACLITEPAALVAELARLKAEAVFARLDGDVIVLGCDTVLEHEGQAFGKPGTASVAAERLRRLRGRAAVLVTGHHVIVRRGDQVHRANRTGTTIIHLADMLDEEIIAYAATGEPERVGGGFTIDGFGGAYVARIDGDPHNVVGVSLPLLRMMLADLGVTWHALWA